jgi:hypothetical protein
VSAEARPKAARAKGRAHIQVPATAQAHEIQRTYCN